MLKDIRFMLLVAFVLFGLGAGTAWYWLSGDLAAKDARIKGLTDAQEQAAKQRKRDQATLARVASEKAALVRSEALARQRLDQALAKNPDWASQPVPEEVRRALD